MSTAQTDITRASNSSKRGLRTTDCDPQQTARTQNSPLKLRCISAGLGQFQYLISGYSSISTRVGLIRKYPNSLLSVRFTGQLFPLLTYFGNMTLLLSCFSRISYFSTSVYFYSCDICCSCVCQLHFTEMMMMT